MPNSLAAATASQSNSPANLKMEVLTPALGRYWQSVPSTRLYIGRPINASTTPRRTIRILKSTMLKSKTDAECEVTITNAGII